MKNSDHIKVGDIGRWRKLKLKESKPTIEKCKIPLNRLISSFEGITEKDFTNEKKRKFEQVYKNEMKKHQPSTMPNFLTNLN